MAIRFRVPLPGPFVWVPGRRRRRTAKAAGGSWWVTASLTGVFLLGSMPGFAITDLTICGLVAAWWLYKQFR